MTRLPDTDAVLATLREIAVPTAPYHEHRVLAAIRTVLDRIGVKHTTDEYGQVFARLQRGTARQIVLMAHTDHPAFEVVEATGKTGTVRVLGGFRGGTLERPARVRVYDDAGDGPVPALIDDLEQAPDLVHNSAGRMRIRAGGDLRPGQWAVLDLPELEISREEIRMGAADDLAGCALILLALEQLAREDGPVDVIGAFTRAEETGLYGARLLVEDELVSRDAIVVSVEASRALPHVPAGGGAVVRTGDFHNTFTNDAERYLRVAAERLALEGIVTQRALLTGGSCEASTFVVHGFSTTGMALPNVNYHNRGVDDLPAPEVVRLDDLRSGIALAVEATHAAAEDARERWWDTAGPVPDEIRTILRRR